MEFFSAKAEYDYLKKEIDNSIQEILNSGTYIQGPKIKQFEEKLAKYVNAKHCVVCSSGTTALVLALDALNLPRGSEIITTPFTFFASASCIHHLGHKIVFADVDYNTFNIDPVKIEEKITAQTKAIIAVDLFGQRANYKEIRKIADKHNLYVIEDAAQSFGAKIDEQHISSDVDVTITSFFPSKNLGGMGDGGACFTNNEIFAERMNILRTHGSKVKYTHDIVGYNFRLDPLKATILEVKLPFVDEFITKRRENAYYYNKNINIKSVILPEEPLGFYHTYNQYTIKVQGGLRNKLAEHLKENGIPTMIYYPNCLHLQKCFEYLGYKTGDFPISEQLTKEVLSLPIGPFTKKEDLELIINTINEFEGK